MRFDLHAIVVIASALGVAGLLGLVPIWVSIVGLVVAAAAIGQHLRATRARELAEEQELIAEHVPELLGMSFVQTATHILKAADEFNDRAPPELKALYAQSLAENVAAWRAKGKTPPVWAALGLMREFEAEWARAKASLDSQSERTP